MSTYSVAEAKNRLPALIDKAIEGERGGHHPPRQAGRGAAPARPAKRQVGQGDA